MIWNESGISKMCTSNQITEDEIKLFVENELIELTSVNVVINPEIKEMVLENILPVLGGCVDNKIINRIVDDLLSQQKYELNGGRDDR